MGKPSSERSDATDRENAISAEKMEEMLKEALARPGVKEIMDAYNRWREIDNSMDAWREATADHSYIITTNTSDPVRGQHN